METQKTLTITAAAHTAEHAFIGALQKLLGQTLQVRKVEHNKNNGSNTAIISIPQLDIETVMKASVMVNALIDEGREVMTHRYPSLEAARNENPTLRANEQRISGEVRVVEIKDHDVTACVMEHVSNLHECGFFLVSKLSKNGSEYEVEFAVGSHAKNAALALSEKMIKVCNELGANPNTLENTAKKVRLEGVAASRKLKALSIEKLQSIVPVENNTKDIRVYEGVFSGLADEALQEFAGERISEPKTVIILVNKNKSNDTGDSSENSNTSFFIFARNEHLAVDLDCNKVFREIAGVDGRGGGKPHFVTGVVKKEKAEEIVRRIIERTLELS